MRKWKLVTLSAALLAALALPCEAIAQETRGEIAGVVKDSTGGALPGVTVTAVHAATNAKTNTVTNDSGVYRFPTLAPGTYTVSATLAGFNEAKVEKIELGLGQQLKADLTLAIAGVTMTETVRAAPPVVDVKQNAVTQIISADLIDLIPKDRNFLSALTGMPGVNDESRGGGLMIDGASGSENRVIIDGQDATNTRTGVISTKTVVVDFIEQIQVKQSGYSAEFRATTGGVVSAITKSGSNQFHGDVSGYLSGKQLLPLAGAVRPGLRLDPTVAVNPPAQYFTTPRTVEYERETFDPTFSVSGPILKNRAWFFLGLNPSRTNTDREVQWSNPTVNGVTYPAVQWFNAKSTDFTYTYNSTLQLGQNVRARVGGNTQRGSSARTLPSVDANTFVKDGPSVSNSNPATWNPWPTLHTESYNDSLSATFDWVINNKTYSNFTSGYFSNGSGSKDGDFFHGIRRQFGTSNLNYLDVPANLQAASGFADNPSNTFTLYDDYTRYSASGDITRYADWKGQHAFKAGVQLERIGNASDSGQQFPNVSLRWNQTRTTLDQRQVRGTYGYYSVVQQFTQGAIHAWNTGLFLQDQWTFNNKLTLNYGARFDRTNIPSYREENPGIVFGFAEKFAPRVGFAYDIKGDAKWKAYGSWGIFYDIEKLEMPRGAWGAERWVTYYWTLDDYNWPAINCDGTPNSGCPGTYIEQVDLRHVSNDPNNNLVDPNMKPYKTQELVFGLEHELNRLMSVSTRWSHKWLDRTIEDIGVQVPGVGEVFYIANPGYGLGAYPLGTEYPRTPFPVRNYDGVEFNFNRRLANNWSLRANFLISRQYGNYSGLASSDEGGRTSPNVNRVFDGLFMSFTEKGCPAITDCEDLASYGRLQTDRPFQFKLQGTYVAPWGSTIGVNFSASSGALQTTNVTYKSVPVMVYGRGNLGRTPTLSATDVQIGHRLRLPRRMTLNLSLNITNVFDQDTANSLFTTAFQSALTLPGDATSASPFFAGFNTSAAMAAIAAANPNSTTLGRPDVRFGLVNGFQGARSARFTMRLSF